VTIPVSLIGAFGLMYAMGFTINTLTLLSMVLAIGLVVDDAIVMLENIHRHIEEGMPRRQAAIQGAREIGFAIVAMTLTLASVFAPLAFATGRTGRLFIEFALTLAGAVLVSGFIALTLSPMMCSILLKHEKKHSWLYNLVEGWIVGLTNLYRPLARLGAAPPLDRRRVVGRRAGAGGVLFTQLKSELAPTEDRGVVFGLVTAPQGSTPQYTADMMRPIEQIYDRIPEAAAYTAISGFPTVVDGNAVLRLKPWEERTKKQQQITDEVRPLMQQIPGAIAFPLNPPSLGQSFRSTPVEFVLMSQVPYAELQRLTDRFLDEARKYPGVQNLQIDLRLNTPEVRVRINRDKLSDIGITVDTVGRTLETMLGGPPGDALQEGRRAVRRDRAGRAARPHDARRHQRQLRARPRRRHGAAVEPRRRQGRRRAAVAQPLQPAARRQDHRDARAGLLDRRGAEGDGRGGEGRAPADRADRRRRPVARVPQVGRRDLLHVRAGAAVHLPRALRAVRELRRAVRDHAVGAAVDDRARS
jgi:multidrug efflux pump subunit AcrB